ncbi:nitroreductase family protein [Desulfobacterales bacterium HSG2]|nr:nitroreductase family protein [Desulfobacterales bacterium HSG2]
MSLFTVDQEKCKHDGICVDECPLGIIKLEDKESVPVPIESAEDLCINCGHCVAVCPDGALSHKNMTPEQCPPVRKELLLNAEQAEHFLRARRSVRVYKDKPVDRETITKLIDIARFAPSGHNRQPVKWLVIYDSDEVQRLAGLVVDWMRYMLKEQPEMAAALNMDRVVKSWESGIDGICRSAPHVIVAHAPEENPTAPTSGTIALTYLELAAQPLGLGACWAGFFNAGATMWPPMQKALNLPQGHISLGAMMVGYPKYKYHRLPLRNEAEIAWR